jgi:predicted Zn finger-like uncharacterized protein
MLLTICPSCSAQFKVLPEQLNVRQGRVMCGRCRHVFNAFQSLSRVEEPIEAEVGDGEAQYAQSGKEAGEGGGRGESPPETPFVEAAREPTADHLFMREEPLPLPAAFSALESQPPEASPAESTTRPLVAASTQVAIVAERSAEVAIAADAHANDATVPKPAIDLSADGGNPLLVDDSASRELPRAASPRVWRAGVVALFLALLLQVAYAFRTPIVSNYPDLRPTVARFCEVAGCSLSWGRDESVLKIDASELIEAPGKPGRILLTAILVNRGKTKQDLPSLELRLTDNANQVVASRLLHPNDYLGRAIAKDEGLLPNVEQYVNLNLEVSNKSLASGYGLVVFYP